MGCHVTGANGTPTKALDGSLPHRAKIGHVTVRGDHVISSMPMRDLVEDSTAGVGDPDRRAAEALKYRDFLTVVLILRDQTVSPTTGSTSTTPA